MFAKRKERIGVLTPTCLFYEIDGDLSVNKYYFLFFDKLLLTGGLNCHGKKADELLEKLQPLFRLGIVGHLHSVGGYSRNVSNTSSIETALDQSKIVSERPFRMEINDVIKPHANPEYLIDEIERGLLRLESRGADVKEYLALSDVEIASIFSEYDQAILTPEFTTKNYKIIDNFFKKQIKPSIGLSLKLIEIPNLPIDEFIDFRTQNIEKFHSFSHLINKLSHNFSDHLIIFEEIRDIYETYKANSEYASRERTKQNLNVISEFSKNTLDLKFGSAVIDLLKGLNNDELEWSFTDHDFRRTPGYQAAFLYDLESYPNKLNH